MNEPMNYAEQVMHFQNWLLKRWLAGNYQDVADALVAIPVSSTLAFVTNLLKICPTAFKTMDLPKLLKLMKETENEQATKQYGTSRRNFKQA